jgi:hypothetical protein
MSFSILANELQYKIISYLKDDFYALRALRRTNRHLSIMVKAEQIQKALYNYEKVNLHMFMHLEMFPCYKCFGILPHERHWHENLLAEPSTANLGEENAMSRRCRACDAEDGNKFLKSL